ncbi:PO113 protein, partial [Chauna torquata]|nr:PO113 protein [Chauna torquata]
KLNAVNLKDCFFTIPLHTLDCEHFAFSIPSVNNQGLMKRYHWAVFPQGMMNSPTICQVVVAAAVKPSWDAYPQAKIYHDLLIAAADSVCLEATVSHLM